MSVIAKTAFGTDGFAACASAARDAHHFAVAAAIFVCIPQIVEFLHAASAAVHIAYRIDRANSPVACAAIEIRADGRAVFAFIIAHIFGGLRGFAAPALAVFACVGHLADRAAADDAAKNRGGFVDAVCAVIDLHAAAHARARFTVPNQPVLKIRRTRRDVHRFERISRGICGHLRDFSGGFAAQIAPLGVVETVVAAAAVGQTCPDIANAAPLLCIVRIQADFAAHAFVFGRCLVGIARRVQCRLFR